MADARDNRRLSAIDRVARNADPDARSRSGIDSLDTEVFSPPSLHIAVPVDSGADNQMIDVRMQISQELQAVKDCMARLQADHLLLQNQASAVVMDLKNAMQTMMR